jgi:hypothetical protein
VITCEATVVSRRNISGPVVRFQVDNGKVKRINVSPAVYDGVAIGTMGKLTYQGNQMLEFKWY